MALACLSLVECKGMYREACATKIVVKPNAMIHCVGSILLYLALLADLKMDHKNSPSLGEFNIIQNNELIYDAHD